MGTFLQVFLRSLRNTIIVVICSIVWITLLLPFLATPLLILFLIRKLVDFLVLHQHPTYKPITGIEAIYAGSNSVNYSDRPSHSFATVCAGVEVSGLLSVDEIRERTRSTLLKDRNLPNWTFWKILCTPVNCCGYYYWKPLPFINFDEYVKGAAPHLQGLDQILNEWLPLRFEGENRSPWEVLVCKPRVGKYAGRTLIFLKGNHSLVDIVGARDIVLAVLGMKAQDTLNPEVIKVTPWMGVFHFVTIPRMILDIMVGWLLPKWEAEPNLIFNGDCNRGESVNLWDSVDLEQIKRIKQRLDCSFKAVLVCSIFSALRKCMLDANTASQESNMSVLLNTHWPHAPHPGRLAVKATSFFVTLDVREDNTRQVIRDFNSATRSNLEIGTYKFVYYASHINYVLPSFLTPALGQRNILKAFSETDIPFVLGQEVNYEAHTVPGVYINVGLQGVPLTCFTCFTTLGSKVCVAISANKAFIKSAQNLEKLFQIFKHELDVLEIENSGAVKDDEESRRLLLSAP